MIHSPYRAFSELVFMGGKISVFFTEDVSSVKCKHTVWEKHILYAIPIWPAQVQMCFLGTAKLLGTWSKLKKQDFIKRNRPIIPSSTFFYIPLINILISKALQFSDHLAEQQLIPLSIR